MLENARCGTSSYGWEYILGQLSLFRNHHHLPLGGIFDSPPPSWTSRESYLVPPVVVTGTGMLSVVKNCKPLGRTEKSLTPPTPPTSTSSLADRPQLVCPLDIQPLGWSRCCVEQLLPLGAFPPRRMSGFGCSLALPKVSGPLCLRVILRERHGAVNWVDRLGLGPPQGAQCHIVR